MELGTERRCQIPVNCQLTDQLFPSELNPLTSFEVEDSPENAPLARMRTFHHS